MIRCKLSAILGERRIKIRELERRSGVSLNTLLSLYHERAKGVTFDVLDRICKALDIQPGDLLVRVPDEGGEKK
ncbi:transcriptional regulator, XRE family [Ammonifex degensii KC4]|uniref:Transcriptional regulator, XRE family n=1 Tax=Ammonifex degensii (strain DSM 10501 / KC4) TaxID=429009 RepID=C9RA82_AMMDK|nr:helix-turn-helix transcriptional regulator [Ammonifex degensii]ACX51191.1 transcriptional regulator, XRE family [Ammonifex degensii KC4]